MQRLRARSVVFWTLILAGFGTGCLLTSVRSEWVQDHLFGAKPPSPAPERPPNPDPYILRYFNRGSASRIEDLCKGDRYFVDYRVDGFLANVRAEVFVDGDHVSSRRPRHSDGQWPAFETPPRTLKQDELIAIWSAVESTHPLVPLPEVQRREPAEAFEGGALVAFAVCRGGNLWTATGNGSEPDSPAYRASMVLESFLLPPKRPR